MKQSRLVLGIHRVSTIIRPSSSGYCFVGWAFRIGTLVIAFPATWLAASEGYTTLCHLEMENVSGYGCHDANKLIDPPMI